MARITKQEREQASDRLLDALADARQYFSYGDLGRVFGQFIEGSVHADIADGRSIGAWVETPKKHAAKAEPPRLQNLSTSDAYKLKEQWIKQHKCPSCGADYGIGYVCHEGHIIVSRGRYRGRKLVQDPTDAQRQVAYEITEKVLAAKAGR